MNWNDMNTDYLSHFRRLGKIRQSHPVIATGRQRTLDTHTALRFNDAETILIRLVPDEGAPINLFGVFNDGEKVTDLYTGETATVKNGTVTFPRLENRVAIIAKTSEVD